MSSYIEAAEAENTASVTCASVFLVNKTMRLCHSRHKYAELIFK